jgi:nucleoid-associated protein YgaU
MKKIVGLFIIAVLLLSLSFCASAPEEEPEEIAKVTEEPKEEPVEEPKEEPKEEPVEEPKPEPVSEKDIQLAKDALERAEAADAKIYATNLYAEANNSYNEAMDLLESDPDKARELLAAAADKANEAFDTAVYALFDNYTLKFKQYERRLKDIEADKFRPEETNDLYEKVEKAITLFQNENFAVAKQTADELLLELKNFYENLDEEIRWANILKRDTEMYLDEAEEVQAYIWAPEKLEDSVTMYTFGLEAFRRYRLDESIDYLAEAKGFGLQAVRLSPQRKEEYRTEALRKEIEEDIKEASEMTIMSEDGTIIEPEPKENNTPGEKQQSFKLPADEKTAVLGDVSSRTLLEQARELYALGVAEKEKGSYTKANEYFREAGRLLHEYKSMSVGQTKVVEVYEKHTLWFIADQEWNNSFFWPLIWEYNQETINDPDLIYPGETIFIPAR